MGVGEDIRTLKEAIMVGRRHGVRGGKHWSRSYERSNVTTRGCEENHEVFPLNLNEQDSSILYSSLQHAQKLMSTRKKHFCLKYRNEASAQ